MPQAHSLRIAGPGDHDRIEALISDGASLEQVIAAEPTAEFDEARGNPANFLNRSYTSMTR